ncbi:MAG: MerR family transcriptional regulator [Armatimonadota bacterium]|nr:MerR family transcriptional regulator [Armatimonadota bacterium]
MFDFLPQVCDIGGVDRIGASPAQDRLKPKYTVRAVARMTEVKAATLRAWEKRYGVPAPSRTPARYRLYSELDLVEIRWMKARVDEGIPPRQAARLAVERREAGVALETTDALDAPTLVADLKATCLAFDEDGAQQVLRRAAAVLRPTEIMRFVLLPTVAEIGRDWEAGLVTAAQEHFASQLARRYGGRLMDVYQPSRASRPIVCACAPGEQHELGILTVAVELRSRGLPVIYLGQDVPVESLLSSTLSIHPGVVVVAATLPEHLAAVAAARPAVLELERAGRAIVWAGPAADRAADYGLPGATAGTIEAALDAIARVLQPPALAATRD